MSSTPVIAVDEATARTAKMAEVLELILDQRYRYGLTKGFFGWTEIPPPSGTEINCKAAAHLAKRLGEEKHGLQGLKVIGFTPQDGFIVPAMPGILALGTTSPEIDTPQLRCWEFDNHYRVQDPHGFNKVYDPIFGSSGNLNPTGVLSSKKMETKVDKGRHLMISEYGEKYRITRGIGVQTTVELLTNMPVDRRFLVDDLSFR